jgi:allantoin racemase
MAVRSRARRFGIVTTFEGAVPGIEALLTAHGVAESCPVRAAGVGVAEAAEGGPEALKRIADAVGATVADGAEAVLLGSGGLTGSVLRLRPLVDIPLVDGVEAAIRAAWSVSADAF